MMRTLIFAFSILTSTVAIAAQERPIDSYYARLSERDHFNIHGERLRSAAAILRQDRANFYVYGKQDAEDESDNFFSDKANRARLERMLGNGYMDRNAEREILDGTPLVHVQIYPDHIMVTVE